MNPGDKLGPYEIKKPLGAGGMGEVYLAEDTRLGRQVAIKVLPADVASDPLRRERFEREAKAVAALKHPSIVVLYSVEDAGDVHFITMELVEGGTLLDAIPAGGLPAERFLTLALQLTQALAVAHEHGIIHRDLKPTNIMLAADGRAKILDFGLAKQRFDPAEVDDATEMPTRYVTEEGGVVGTVAYMSPEQLRGHDVDSRSDVFSLGVVLYQMATGANPFARESRMDMASAILNEMPPPLSGRSSAVPKRAAAIIDRMLAKDRDDRPASIREVIAELEQCREQFGAPASIGGQLRVLGRMLRRPAFAIPAALILVAAAFLGYRSVERSSRASWARSEAIPEITRLAAEDNYLDAYALAVEAEQYIPDDPILAGLFEGISFTSAVATEPAGADISYRVYDALDDPWTPLGESPVDEFRLARGVYRFRIEKPGYEALDFVSDNRTGAGDPAVYTLRQQAVDARGADARGADARGADARGAEARGADARGVDAQGLDTGMVEVTPPFLGLELTGFNYQEYLAAPSYLIDRYEVTNAEFKEFVDAGGYENRAYWQHEFVAGGTDGALLSWEQASERMRDTTGRPGPATWAGGTFPEGQARYPVTGVSWYEAAAYAEFRGKSLPTLYHWLGAAQVRFADRITPLANFLSDGPTPVGQRQAMSPPGTHDMAGNVKEWVWNASETDDRYIVGGAWNEPGYMFTYPEVRPPLDRSEVNGFRTVDYAGNQPDPTFLRPLPVPNRNYVTPEPVDDEVFAIYRKLYDYDPTPLREVVEKVETDRSAHWVRETISIDAAYGDERMTVYAFLPKIAEPPYQTVLFFPPTNMIFLDSSADLEPGPWGLEFVPMSGRAFVWPVYQSTFERIGGVTETWPDATQRFTNHVIMWVNDARRTIDYLETRPDTFDVDRIGYYGFSWGGRMGPIVLAMEPRLKLGVLESGALSLRDARPEAHQANFAPRVTVPVLMLNGRYDFVEPVDTAQVPLFNLLGTPAADKRHVLFEAGHSPLPTNQLIQETLGWLDKYFGPVR